MSHYGTPMPAHHWTVKLANLERLRRLTRCVVVGFSAVPNLLEAAEAMASLAETTREIEDARAEALAQTEHWQVTEADIAPAVVETYGRENLKGDVTTMWGPLNLWEWDHERDLPVGAVGVVNG